eukprot:5872133-Alexandrium_andersonii.AAC.1
MSASLVGSEMCIRDRSLSTTSHGLGRSAKLATCFGSGRAASSHAAHRRSRATAWTSGCLLYTSDAADDM